MKVLTVVGARPQFIKAAAVSRVFKSLVGIEEVIIHTGQHYDQNMSDIFFAELEIPQPNYRLGIGGSSHGSMTGQMLEQIEKVVVNEKPDVMLVYGDTNSTLAGALAASKIHVPVAHVEAGLRSFNKKMPEEQNRVLTDHLATVLFTPTKQAIENLELEGIKGASVVGVGDVMQDVSDYYGDFNMVAKSNVFKSLGINRGDYVLSTVHRAENTDDEHRLRTIALSLIKVAKSIDVVLPLHPRTKSLLSQIGLFDDLKSVVKVTKPLGYLEMVALEKSAKLIVTDSGGVQKEAYFHKVPCVTLRDETEWVELVEEGYNVLCPPTSTQNIVSVVTEALAKEIVFSGAPIYGDGDSATKIALKLVELFSN